MLSFLSLSQMRRLSIVLMLIMLLVGCHSSNSGGIVLLRHAVKLGSIPVIDATVTLYDLNHTKLYATQTNTSGRWKVSKNITIDSEWVRIVANGQNMTLCAIVEKELLFIGRIEVDLLSTLGCEDVGNEIDTDKIQKILQASPFSNTYFAYYLYDAGAAAVAYQELSWREWKNNDSDHDGLSNGEELILGLNPASSDSDHDTLLDNDELTLYHTEANSSDSDGDYIPDNIELSSGSNPLVADEDGDGVLDGLGGDPLFGYQWYLHNPQAKNICTTTEVKTVAGNDLDVFPLYHQTLGSTHGRMIVQVVDGGVEQHPDLDISLEHSYNSIDGGSDPTPIEGISPNPVQIFYRGHGTAVAGIIGAKGLNGIGVRGVAPAIEIAGSNWLESEEVERLSRVWYDGSHAIEIAISNNSWGAKFINEITYEAIMEKASKELRGGKGRIFVFAAGNDREEHSNANLSYLLNNPYGIAVTAINHENHYASYATPGSNVLVSAYGGEHYYEAPTIMTTFSPGLSMSTEALTGKKGPITVAEDEDRDYTYAMNASSAAAPMVSGALALVLDMCPELTWRDVRWLIAKHATKIDVEDSAWIQNSAGWWHNNNYGFGLINAVDMVASCTSPLYQNLPSAEMAEVGLSFNKVIPDTNESIELALDVGSNLVIEWIGLTLEIDHPYAGDLDIELISPAGTHSHIMGPNFLKSNAYELGFRFSTVSLMGEQSQGKWRVEIRDALHDDQGTFHAATLEIRGHK